MDQNLVMYGHNLWNGAMFSYLVDIYNKGYVNDKNRNRVYIQTEEGLYVYEMFAAYMSDINDEFMRINFSDQSDFIDFCRNCQKRAANYAADNMKFAQNDKIITMVTCPDADDSEKRVVVNAKMVNFIGGGVIKVKKLSRLERKKLIAVYKNSLSSITVNNYNKENIKYYINQAEKHFPQNKMTSVFSDLEERAGKFVYWKYDYISRDYVNLYITIEKGILKYAVQIYNQENVRKLSNVLMWFKITKDKLPKEPDEALILLLHYRMQRRQKALADIKEDIKILENENVKLKLELLKSEKDRKSLLANYRKTEEYLEYYAEQSRFHDGVLWTKNFNFMKCTTNDCLEEGYIKNGERTYIITAENGNSAVLYYKKNLCTGHITTILSGKLANGKSLTMNTAVNCSYNDIILILHKMFINNIVYISLQSESDLEAVTDKASNMRLTLK